MSEQIGRINKLKKLNRVLFLLRAFSYRCQHRRGLHFLVYASIARSYVW